MKSINILFPFEFNISEGGAQQSIIEIIRYLDKRRFNIHVFLPRPSKNSRIPSYSSQIKRIRGINVETGIGSYGVWEFKKIKPFTTILHGVLFICFIHNFLKRNRIHIIHTNMYVSLFWCCIYKFFFRNRFQLIHHYRGFNNAGDFIIQFFQKNIDVLVCTSDIMAEKWKEKIPPSKIRCIYNTVNAPCELPVCKKENFIINVARISRIKNQLLFLKIADYLINTKKLQYQFRLIGDIGLFDDDYEYYRYLLAFIAEKNLSEYVQFCGHKVSSELISIYKKAFLCVGCCSVESFGRVFIESMAWGTPVIAVNGGGILSIIDHGVEGLLYPAEDFQSAGNFMIDLLKDPFRYKAIRDNGFKKVTRCFHSALKIQDYEKLYQNLFNKRKNVSSRDS